MAWTDPNLVNWDVGDPLTAADMQTYVRDNLLALKDPASAIFEFTGIYTTSSTTYVDVDSTNMSLTVITDGGDLLVGLTTNVGNSSGGTKILALGLDIDGVPLNKVLVVRTNVTGDKHNASFVRRVMGLSAGSHTIKLQYRTNSGVIQLNPEGAESQFWVREVS